MMNCAGKLPPHDFGHGGGNVSHRARVEIEPPLANKRVEYSSLIAFGHLGFWSGRDGYLPHAVQFWEVVRTGAAQCFA